MKQFRHGLRFWLAILLSLPAFAAFTQERPFAFPFHDQESFSMYPQSAGEIEFFQGQDEDDGGFTVAIDNLATPGKREYFDATLSYDGGVNFLHLSSENFGTWDWLVLFGPETSPTSGDGLMIAYPRDAKEPYLFIWKSDGWMRDAVYKASSRLVEGKTVYDEGNLGRLDLHAPWVPHGKPNGIGESVTISAGPNRGNFNQLIFSNGFISADKPYLFAQNNRVRTLRISGSKGEFDLKIPVEDGTNLQTIALPKAVGSVRVEIIDVYPGTKYSDTCINFMIPVSR